jgi:hypothetical protein
MKRILTVCLFGTFLGLLLLCSCATKEFTHPQLPAEVTMNKDAGCGGMLFVTLRLENGQEMPFMVDTGASGTVIDKSLEPKLGKRRGTVSTSGWEGTGKANAFPAPAIYLGNTRLLTEKIIYTSDLKHPSGILGMDCLKHYCIQLDFAARTMRFLEPGQVNAAELGKAFPLTFRGNLPYIDHAGLIGGSRTNLLIDVGCRVDGLEDKSAIKGLAQILRDCVWDGEIYTNLTVASVEHGHALGLNFFARHLVTLDFPNRTMYLKQTRVGPLPGDSSMQISNDEIGAPAEYIESLKEKGELPGLSKDDQGVICLETYSNFGRQSVNAKGVAYTRAYFNSQHKTVTFAFCKSGDSASYHYQVARESKESPWKLQKAWRTDQNGRIVEEYPIP